MTWSAAESAGYSCSETMLLGDVTSAGCVALSHCLCDVTWCNAGCCYGGQLTALIIPPQDDKPAAVLQSFIENAPLKESAAEAGKEPSVDPLDKKHSVPNLSDMDANFVLVPAKKAYSQKKSKANKS